MFIGGIVLPTLEVYQIGCPSVPPPSWDDVLDDPQSGLQGWDGLWQVKLRLPSGYVKIAIENGHRNSGFSH